MEEVLAGEQDELKRREEELKAKEAEAERALERARQSAATAEKEAERLKQRELQLQAGVLSCHGFIFLAMLICVLEG